MPSMTMPFTVKNPQESAALRPGEAISFRLAVTEKEAWIDQITKISAAEGEAAGETGTSAAASNPHPDCVQATRCRLSN